MRATIRADPEAVGRTLVSTSSGALVPLREVADLSFTHGPDMVRSEAGKLRRARGVDVAGRPIVDYVNEARAVVAERVSLPAGTRIAWVGQFEYFERAKARLRIVLPITLALVALLLYLNTRSAVETAMVMLAVPFSLIGAIWLLFALGYNLSVAVWVGIIALAGSTRRPAS
jgi:Cu(I)/Ag(I) efflux system membrane protein CusA/SilA